MDRRERLDDPEEAVRTSLDALQARLWTAMPGIIQSFDPGSAGSRGPTCTVQCAIQAKQQNKDGSTKLVNIPPLVDCPVQFPGGGGASLTFPLAHGDECLVVFASRCIDSWWQSGGIQAPAEIRFHNLSDGFIIPGVRSNPRALIDISTTTAQFRSDDGSTFVDLDPVGQIVNVTAPGGIKFHGPVSIVGGLTTDTLDVSGNTTLGGSGGSAIETADGPSTTATAV